jgi:dipeptidyl aminopeptidase/acylaminoacyl peptidase
MDSNDLTMVEELIKVKNRFGEYLEARFCKPENQQTYPVIMFVHGFDMDLHEYKNSFDEIATYLLNAGFATFQFSFAGCGHSEGNHIEMTLERQGAQIEDCLEWLQKCKDVQKEKIGLIAQSLGVPSTLTTSLKGIYRYCFISGVHISFMEGMVKKCKENGEEIQYNGVTKIPRSHGRVTLVGPEFWKSIRSFKALAQVKHIQVPTLFVHGDKDEKVSTEEVIQVFNVIPGSKKKLKVFVGGDHGICDVPKEMRQELLQLLCSWFTPLVKN